MALSAGNDNLKHRYRLSWYEMRIFLYQFVLTFFPLVLLSAFATYIYVSKSHEKLEISTEAAASQLQGNLDELLVQLQGYYVGAASDDRVKWFVENEARYSDYSKLIGVSDVLNGNSVFSEYVSGFTIVNFRTGWVYSSRGMYPYDKLINKSDVEALYKTNRSFFNPYYWNFNPDGYGQSMVPREYADHEGLCFIMRLPTIGLNSDAMIIIKIDYNGLIAKVSNNLSKFDGAIVMDDGNVIYSTNDELARKFTSMSGSTVRLSDGKTYTVVKKYSKVLGMSYYIAGDISSAWGDVDSIWGGTLIIIILAAAMFVAVLWSSRKLYQPVAALAGKVGSLAGHIDAENTIRMGESVPAQERQPAAAHRRNELENIARQVNILVSNKEQAEELSQAHKEKLLVMTTRALIKGELSGEELKRNMEQLDFSAKRFYMAAVGIVRNRNTYEPVDDALVKELIGRFTGDINELFYLPVVFHSSVLVFTAASDGEVMLNMKMERLYNSINLYLAKENPDLQLVMGVSSIKETLGVLRSAYKEARKAVEPKLKGKEGLAFYSPEDGSRTSHYNYDTVLEKKIKEAVEKCDMESATRYMDEFVDDMFNHGVGNDNYVYVYRMIMTVLMIPSELGAVSGQSINDSDIFSKASQIYDSGRLKKYLRADVLEPIILSIDEAQGSRSGEIMERIKQVVCEKDGDITLSECAEMLDYHPNYLWKIIKNEAGMTFTEYIAQYKTERAKELLTTTDMSVAAIAEKLKYTNAQNFIRFFSKMTDMTPGKYRQEFKKR